MINFTSLHTWPSRLVIFVLCALAANSACSRSDRTDDSPDKITNAESRFTLVGKPDVDILGTRNAEAQFSLAAAATRLSNGSLAVGDAYDAVVRVFSPTGSLVRTIGGRGRGPTEFQSAAWVDQCSQGDSLFVWDALEMQMSVIDSAGTIVRHFRLPSPPATARCSRSGIIALLKMPSNFRRPTPSGDNPMYRAELILVNTEGATIASLGEIPVGEARPLGPVTRIAVNAEHVVVGTADSPAFDIYDVHGALKGTVRFGSESRKATQKHHDAAIDAMAKGLTDRADREALKEYLSKMPRPENLPAYTNLFISDEGTIFGVTSPPGEPTELHAVSSSGQSLGRITFPIELRVLDVTESYVVGTYEREDGEQHVVTYRLNRD
jgi:hypothetical protein